MIELVRKKSEKWIFQKNISSKKLIGAYIKVISENSTANKEDVQKKLRTDNAYKGRSQNGSLNTMGVRFSQMCFYMFGYKTDNSTFIPSQTTLNILESEEDANKNMLCNLFALQFPHPYSRTPRNFKIYAGRLIIKLLTEDRIGKKLYIDEMVWFLPFLRTINDEIYEELIESILEYRKLSLSEKKQLFSSVDNYVELFSNCLHEINYYLVKIFKEFKVLDTVVDSKHNDGKLIQFKHGKTATYRSDKIGRSNCSGYIKLNSEILKIAEDLVRKFSPFDKPTALDDDFVFSKKEWISDLYESDLIKYLNVAIPKFSASSEIVSTITNMTYMSKYSAVDGKDFEKSLKPVFELFRENLNVEIISGAGDTDLLCTMEKLNETRDIYKVNVDAKSRKSSLNLNPTRLNRHLAIHSSKYCIVVAPRFSRGTILDIEGYPIVTITADSLARYCSKECLSNKDYLADYSAIDEIILNNLGQDITAMVDKLVTNKYGITI